jgi:hypothetical protein
VNDLIALVPLAGVFVVGACSLWLAVDALRRRRAFWMEGDEFESRSGHARRRDEPVRYWAWVIIYLGTGVLLTGFPLWVVIEWWRRQS